MGRLAKALAFIGSPDDPVVTALGSRLIQVHQRMTAAISTAARKFRASLSYRVAMRRKSLREQKARSILLRWR
jgi:hypothetical protein